MQQCYFKTYLPNSITTDRHYSLTPLAWTTMLRFKSDKQKNKNMSRCKLMVQTLITFNKTHTQPPTTHTHTHTHTLQLSSLAADMQVRLSVVCTDCSIVRTECSMSAEVRARFSSHTADNAEENDEDVYLHVHWICRPANLSPSHSRIGIHTCTTFTFLSNSKPQKSNGDQEKKRKRQQQKRTEAMLSGLLRE